MHIWSITLLLFFYLLYVQFSPGMGNIWYRNNEYFSLDGALKIIFAPLHLYYMWYPFMWDINFLMWILFYFLTLFLARTFNIFDKNKIKHKY